MDISIYFADNRLFFKVITRVLLGVCLFFSGCYLATGCKSADQKVVKRGAQFSKARMKLMAIKPLGQLAELDSSIKWHPVVIGPVKKTVTEVADTQTGKQTPPAQITVNIDSAFKAGAKSATVTCPPCPPQTTITKYKYETDSIPYESTAKLDSMYLEMQIAAVKYKDSIAKKDKAISALFKQNVTNHNSAVKWRKRTLWTWIPFGLLVGGAVALKVAKKRIPFVG